jgi:MoaA/NifB/PqqE/SkfB family radical SAM enzyme
MDEDLAKSVLDQIAELNLAEKVTFHVMGEPLLHPRLFEILDHARLVQLPVGLTTNGALLTPSIIEKIAERDLYQVDISLQSPDAKSFGATRGARIDFESYRMGLLDMLAACFARPSPPILKIRMMTTRFAGKMREKLGIPNFMGTNADLRKTILEWSQLIYERLDLNRDGLEQIKRNIPKIKIHAWNVIEISPKVFIETYVLTDWGNAFTDGDVIDADHGYCFGMRDHFAVLYNGDVVLCCVDYDGNTVVGNIKDSSLLEIFKSPELKEIMEGFQTNRLIHPYCKRCLGSTSRIGHLLKPSLSVIGLKVLKPFLYRNYKLYE